MKSRLLIIIVLIVIIAAAAWIWHSHSENALQSTLPPSISAVFTCPDGEQIAATFINGSSNSVDLTFSDGTSMSLPQAVSADGARYANADGSFVFWNVGNSAMVEENGTTTESDCVASSTDAS